MFLAAALTAGIAGPYAFTGGERILVFRPLRNIIIDPGHGGVKPGAKGKFGTLEKDVTLAVSLKLKALIEKTMPFRVILTRDKDLDVSLESRAAVANNNDAQVFISIHANGSVRSKSHGAETFFMNVNASDEETRKLAYLENTGEELEKRIADEAQDAVKMILWDMAQAAYVRQSQRLAEMVQEDLNLELGLENRGIKQAAFKVLQGVACPAILVEARLHLQSGRGTEARRRVLPAAPGRIDPPGPCPLPEALPPEVSSVRCRNQRTPF